MVESIQELYSVVNSTGRAQTDANDTGARFWLATSRFYPTAPGARFVLTIASVQVLARMLLAPLLRRHVAETCSNLAFESFVRHAASLSGQTMWGAPASGRPYRTAKAKKAAVVSGLVVRHRQRFGRRQTW